MKACAPAKAPRAAPPESWNQALSYPQVTSGRISLRPSACEKAWGMPCGTLAALRAPEWAPDLCYAKRLGER